MQSKEIQNKMKLTMIERYGVDNAMKNNDIKIISIKKMLCTKIERGIISEDVTEYTKYKRIVYHYTNKAKKELLEKWDGKDHYDNEYIKDNFYLHHMNQNYPNIDHKISIIFGFSNNIDPKIIGDISNLCITKRKINSEKRGKNQYISL